MEPTLLRDDEMDTPAHETSVYTSISALCGRPTTGRKPRRHDDQPALLDDEPAQPGLFD